jgi:pyruvate dehydrogenase E2 component (dihydrolipoamide acetyltransferase)
MEDSSFTAIPLTPLRKAIATRMLEAQQTIPQYRITADIKLDQLLALRDLKSRDKTRLERVSINDLVIKACGEALVERPELNVVWAEGAIHRYRDVDISVVIAVDGGLVTPVIRRVNLKSVRQITQEMRDFSARAAARKLKMPELLGGTFSVSNLGRYGVDQFDAIINPPQCAILAVGAAKPRAIVENGEIKQANIMKVTLSLDHRAIDGAIGAEFLMALRGQLERPAGLFAK